MKSSEGVAIHSAKIVIDSQSSYLDADANEGFIHLEISGMARALLLPYEDIKTDEVRRSPRQLILPSFDERYLCYLVLYRALLTKCDSLF